MIGVFEELMVYIKILNDILLFIYFENLQIQQTKKNPANTFICLGTNINNT